MDNLLPGLFIKCLVLCTNVTLKLHEQTQKINEKELNVAIKDNLGCS